ncbi:E3 ubiquitin-protein ligase sina [Armadillidium vulgare]|nr:E3 ubiquitin-protein ligase sina [Armadillidium vulgare]
MANQRVNLSKNVTQSVPNSPKRQGFSSGSDDCEEWSSCCDESVPGTPLKNSSAPSTVENREVDSQERSNLIRRHISSNEINQEKETPVGSICQNFPFPSEKDGNCCNISLEKQKDSNCGSSEFSENNLKVEATTDYDAMYSIHGIRKTSYLKAMTVPGIILEPSSFSQIEDCASLSEEALASPKFDQSLSFDSPISGSSLQIESSGSLLPTLNPHDNGSNISRSISFNDKILDSPKRTLELHKCSSVESSNCSISTPSLQTSKGSRLLQSTPGRLQIISKHSSATSSPERDPYSGSFSSFTKEKSSLKNLTSTFSRRLSFRKLKSNRKQKENSLIYNAANGILPTEQGIVSYEGLLRLFECPGCHNFMTPPLLQCRKGHLLCEKCKVSLKATCPKCKQRVTDNTNYMMEQVCQLVRFPCQFGKYGCPEYHIPKHKTDHEHFCVFRPVHCHYETSGCQCVLPLKEMNLHIGSCNFKYKGTHL